MTIRFEGGNLAGATRQAASYCGALDRKAALQMVMNEAGERNVTVFNCV